MKRTVHHQRLDAALGEYLALTKVLMADLVALLDAEAKSRRGLVGLLLPETTEHWRRNYVRAAAALVEGATNTLRDMCAVALDVEGAPPLLQKERDVLRSEAAADNTSERIKLVLRAAYKLFGVQPMPDFGGEDWTRATGLIAKRHDLMHPKRAADLVISDASWVDLNAGTAWLMAQFRDLFGHLLARIPEPPPGDS